MIQRSKKKFLFLVGIMVVGILGVVSDYMRTNYSRSTSLLLPTAYADTPAPISGPGGGDSGDSGGCGCGGCSGGDGSA